MNFTVYILYSALHNEIYIGFTSNLIQRFYSHNKLGTKGFTKNFRPWVVIYTEVFVVKHEAMVRESQLKSANGRSWIWNRIAKQFHLDGFITI